MPTVLDQFSELLRGMRISDREWESWDREQRRQAIQAYASYRHQVSLEKERHLEELKNAPECSISWCHNRVIGPSKEGWCRRCGDNIKSWRKDGRKSVQSPRGPRDSHVPDVRAGGESDE